MVLIYSDTFIKSTLWRAGELLIGLCHVDSAGHSHNKVQSHPVPAFAPNMEPNDAYKTDFLQGRPACNQGLRAGWNLIPTLKKDPDIPPLY